MNNSRIIGMIQSAQKADMTLGILTKVDRAQPDDVRDRLRGDADDYVRLGEGYIGIRNPDTNVPAEANIPIDEWGSTQEVAYFRRAFPELAGARLTGGARMSERVVQMLEDYIQKKWVTEVGAKLEEWGEKLKSELVSLGEVPEQGKEREFLGKIRG